MKEILMSNFSVDKLKFKRQKSKLQAKNQKIMLKNNVAEGDYLTFDF